MQGKKTRVSVVIPAYNRPENLEKAIEALSGQTLAKKDYEVIVICGKNRETLETCKNSAKNTENLSCTSIGSDSPAAKRNEGTRKAKGKIIAFTDDDCIPENTWLEKILEKFGNDKTIVGVEGLTYTNGKQGLYSNAPVNPEGGLYPTCNIAYRKETLEKTGGFDEAYRFYREDSDLAFRAMELGRIEFAKDARVLHPPRKVPLLRPLETLFLLKEDVRLMKKMPGKYKKHLGKAFGKEILKALASYTVAAGFLYSYTPKPQPIAFTALALAWLAYCAWALQAMKKSDNWKEFLAFAALTLARGILFFPFLAWYSAVVW